MRILHIVGTMDPAAGGPTEAIRMLVRHQPPGYSSEVATLDRPEAGFLSELAAEGTVVRPLGTGGWYSRKMTRWLRDNRGRFDRAIVHGLWEYTGLAARTTLGGKVPYVVFPHGMLDPYFKRATPAKHWKKTLYWLLAEFWNLRAAARVVFTTETEARLAQSTFWPASWKPAVAALGADSPPAEEPALVAAFEARCPELRSRRFLLFLGRIDVKKGCDLLLQAFLQVCDDDPELHLLMAGPDPAGWGTLLRDRPDLKPCLARVHWPGMLTGDVKWGALAACEAFVLPSHQENFGIAVVEALASGRAVLISDQVNLADEVLAAGCGLVEPDTLEGTARLLRRWKALSAEQREAMERKARTAFLTRYTMRRNAAAVLHLVERAEAAGAAEPVPEAP
jgi:glycosyltransferase involved in cell wall biosynthesis